VLSTVGLAAGLADNRRLEARPDVLTFTSDPQAADLEVIGPVRVRLHVLASAPYIDLRARLCDVTPRGRSINISDGIVRLTRCRIRHPASRRG
jgi:predicted acyl esterase